jgi:hypothetical protein
VTKTGESALEKKRFYTLPAFRYSLLETVNKSELANYVHGS